VVSFFIIATNVLFFGYAAFAILRGEGAAVPPGRPLSAARRRGVPPACARPIAQPDQPRQVRTRPQLRQPSAPPLLPPPPLTLRPPARPSLQAWRQARGALAAARQPRRAHGGRRAGDACDGGARHPRTRFGADRGRLRREPAPARCPRRSASLARAWCPSRAPRRRPTSRWTRRPWRCRRARACSWPRRW
jgi:hypothetical protein